MLLAVLLLLLLLSGPRDVISGDDEAESLDEDFLDDDFDPDRLAV